MKLAQAETGEKWTDARRDEHRSGGVMIITLSIGAQEQQRRWPFLDSRNTETSQANKGIRRMPRRQEPKKDAVSCEKPRGTASKY